MTDRRWTRLGVTAGVLGSLGLVTASIVSALAYTGSAGEPYSPLNHWVSELGEVAVSRLATVFNIGLVLGGVCLAVFIVAFAAVRSGRLRYAYAAIGVVAGIAGAAVGVFPMDGRRSHAVAALTFFDLGSIMVGLASMDIWRGGHPPIPRWIAGLGFVTVVATLGFLVAAQATGPSGVDVLDRPGIRPAFSAAATLEWTVIVAVIAWVFLVAIAWWRSARARPAG